MFMIIEISHFDHSISYVEVEEKKMDERIVTLIWNA